LYPEPKMKKLFSTFLFTLIFVIFTFLFAYSGFAQNSVSVKAGVGTYNFSVSGFVSPYASIVMTQDSYFMSSGTADEKGYFLLDPALVSKGFTSFCLEAVDFRRIGTSYTCFNIDPVESDYTYKEIFLPPTVGLSGRRITPSTPIIATGYSMPWSMVKVNLEDNRYIETKADQYGYYNTEVKNIPQGKYVLFATSTYEKKYSEIPTRKFGIESVGFISTISGSFWPLLLFVLILLLIILLIIFLKRRRKRKEDKETSRPRASSS
jgi:hypothetical protein